MKAAATVLLVLSYLSNCHGWTLLAAPQHSSAVQIDAGNGQVVMRDTSFRVYFLSGSSWNRLGSVPLKHVTVGPAGIWGVSKTNMVNKLVGGDFIPVPGQSLQQVDAGGIVEIVGASPSNNIYCLNSNSASTYPLPGSTSWTNIPGALKYFSCGPYGCWGVNSADNIYVTEVTPTTCATTGWTQVPGAAILVEVGTDGSVFVVNSFGQVYQRVGITPSLPQGTDWNQIQIPLFITSLSYDLGRLWLVTDNNCLMMCTQ